jgi:hypothetical protein
MSNEQNDDKTCLISLPEAADLYGFNPKYLAQLANKGRLQAQKIGGIWIATPENVEIYIRSRPVNNVGFHGLPPDETTREAWSYL